MCVCVKYLGVYMDNKLNWNTQINTIKLTQINTIKLRLSKGISILAKIRHYVPEMVLRTLYFTFVNSLANTENITVTATLAVVNRKLIGSAHELVDSNINQAGCLEHIQLKQIVLC